MLKKTYTDKIQLNPALPPPIFQMAIDTKWSIWEIGGGISLTSLRSALKQEEEEDVSRTGVLTICATRSDCATSH